MIRKVAIRDTEAIASICNYYIQNTVITFEENSVSPSDMRRRIKKVKEYGLPWYVAECDGEVIGYAYATKWNDRSAYRHTAETSVYLSNSWLSNGWGTKLYETLFDELENASMHAVIGGITLPNPASIALHEKFGMEKVAHFKQVGFKFDQWLDVGYWQVLLNVY